MLSCFGKSAQTERQKSFLINGSALLDEIIVSFNGKHNIPIRNFTCEEIFKATDSFNHHFIFHETSSGRLFKSLFGQRPFIILHQYQESDNLFTSLRNHNIVITSQMSHHKNVMKLIGYCLEYKIPTLVYECPGTETLSSMLYDQETGNRVNKCLSWKERLKIAKDVANVLVYLHTAFPTPIVHRDIQPNNIIVDQSGVAKMFDFTLCISLPPGESYVEDAVVGTMGHLELEYITTGIVTTKVDTFHFGMLLLHLLTGRKKFYDVEKGMTLIDVAETGMLHETLDPTIYGDGGTEKSQQVEALLAIALKCTKDRENRPEMLDAAKEIRQLDRPI